MPAAAAPTLTHQTRPRRPRCDTVAARLLTTVAVLTMAACGSSSSSKASTTSTTGLPGQSGFVFPTGRADPGLLLTADDLAAAGIPGLHAQASSTSGAAATGVFGDAATLRRELGTVRMTVQRFCPVGRVIGPGPAGPTTTTGSTLPCPAGTAGDRRSRTEWPALVWTMLGEAPCAAETVRPARLWGTRSLVAGAPGAAARVDQVAVVFRTADDAQSLLARSPGDQQSALWGGCAATRSGAGFLPGLVPQALATGPWVDGTCAVGDACRLIELSKAGASGTSPASKDLTVVAVVARHGNLVTALLVTASTAAPVSDATAIHALGRAVDKLSP